MSFVCVCVQCIWNGSLNFKARARPWLYEHLTYLYETMWLSLGLGLGDNMKYDEDITKPLLATICLCEEWCKQNYTVSEIQTAVQLGRDCIGDHGLNFEVHALSDIFIVY